MSDRKPIAVQVPTLNHYCTVNDRAAARTAMLKTARADGYTDIAKLNYIGWHKREDMPDMFIHQFQAVAQ